MKTKNTTMKSVDIYGFSSDRPIARIEDDLLGRAGFAKDLATALSSWKGNDSLVVALHGDWGSGKSSIKNMAVSELEKESGTPQIIEFNPWEWAAQEKITSSFFQEISATIGRKDRSKQGKKLASTLKRYGLFLNTGGSLVTGFSAALPTLFVIAAALGIGGSFSDDVWIQNTTNALLGLTVTWAAVLKWGRTFLNKLAGNTEATAKEKELSLSQLRQELKTILSERDNSLLVVMDDLDRLTSEQLRMVFQLVKANTEFPNVVFLLLFQRGLVEEKLDDGTQTGRDFLEKIIQVPFDIPKIEISRIHHLLFNNLDKILEQDKTALAMFDSGYWGNIFQSSIFAYFDNLRNVYRFSSTLSFHFSLLRGKSVFEVNPVDLIAIECLRLFEPDVYNEIANHKDIFTNKKPERSSDSEDGISAILESILSKSTEGKKDYVKELLLILFPAMDNISYSNDYSMSWLREMRVCHPTNFDKYFQFTIPSDELSNSDLQDMLKLTSNRDGLLHYILSLKERGILKNALAQFESYVDQIPLENADPFIKALLDVGDKVDHESVGFSMFSSNTHLIRLVIWLLKRNENVQERGQILLKCFKDSQGISVVESILMGDESRREKSDSDLVLADTEFDELKLEFVKKLDELAENRPNDLINSEHLVSFLFRWKRWGKEKDVTTWINDKIKEPTNCISFLRGFIIKTYSHGMNDYVAKVKKSIKISNIEEFVSIRKIHNSINKLDMDQLSEEDAEVLDVFHEAVGR
jgi:predicted KAP-like P-loop ATPase